MSIRSNTINSICHRLHECEGELRLSTSQEVDGVIEPMSLNLVAAILGDLRREVLALADSEYVTLNKREV